MLKRLLDILFSLTGLLILLPLFVVISIVIKLDSKGSVFYKQVRIGKNFIPFRLIKFRTMSLNADKAGLLTVGGRDPRVTAIGYYLRKYKIDELPQLLNVLFGTMSLVGPRPEVPKYVELYTEEQRKVLQVKPGITDLASLDYFSENELLAQSEDPEKTYIKEVMPAKLKLNLRYIEKANVLMDIQIIMKTLLRILNH